jgi:CYTH domain-containing protein
MSKELRETKVFLTVKESQQKKGTTRFEWKGIPTKRRESLLGTLVKSSIKFATKCVAYFFEIDEFFKELHLCNSRSGINFENEQFIKPDWLGSSDRRHQIL